MILESDPEDVECIGIKNLVFGFNVTSSQEGDQIGRYHAGTSDFIVQREVFLMDQVNDISFNFASICGAMIALGSIGGDHAMDMSDIDVDQAIILRAGCEC